MSVESILRDNVAQILASILMHEGSIKGDYSYLDREDIRENLLHIRGWVKRYDKLDTDGYLSLVKRISGMKGISFFKDVRDAIIEEPGSEQKVVDLDESTKVRPVRVNRLQDITNSFDEVFVWDSLANGVSNMRSSSAKDKRTPAQRVSDISKLVTKFSNLMNGKDSVQVVDTANLSSDELGLIEEGAILDNIYWPLTDIQDSLKGVYEKSLNFVAAPQGSYKTRFLVQMAAQNLLGGMNTAYVSAEMDRHEMAQAIFYAAMCRTEAWASLYGKDSKWHKASKKACLCSSYKEVKQVVPDFFEHVINEISNPTSSGVGRLIVLDATQTPGLEEIVEALELKDVQMREVSQDPDAGFHIVYLDYLGILDTPKDIRKKSQDEQGEWRAGFAKKRLAMGFCGRGIPVVSAHQINREGQKRTDKKDGGLIRSYDLAGSGWIERFADSCVVLKKLDNGQVQIHSVKSRRSADVQPFLCEFNPNTRYLVKIDATNADVILDKLSVLEKEL